MIEKVPKEKNKTKKTLKDHQKVRRTIAQDHSLKITRKSG